MARAKAKAGLYQVKVTLGGIRPPIWRRIELTDCRLDELHRVLQDVMGWDDYHLHDFRVGEVVYGEPDPDGMLECEDETGMTLARLVARGHKKFTYTYDFGDNWGHAVLVEKVLPVVPGVRYPRCTAGKRACPPEDCGGSWGYAGLLAALADPSNERHAELRDWVGGEFDPEAFDLDAVNARLRGEPGE